MAELCIYPDTDRVDAVLLERARQASFVDASGVLTFAQWIAWLNVGSGRRLVSALTARVVLWTVASSLEFRGFGDWVKQPGFAREALELFSSLKQGGANPRQFLAWAKRLPEQRQPRALSLARLFDAFETKMAALGLADREDQLQAAIVQLTEKGLPERFKRFRSIQLEGIHDFSWLRQELILAFAAACERAQIRFRVIVPGAGAPAVDASVDGFFSEVEKRAQDWSRFEAFKEDPIAQEAPLAFLGPKLFAPEHKTQAQIPLVAPVVVHRFATAREEARQLARQVRLWVEEGIPCDRIAVAFPDLGPEAEAVVEALDEVGIPGRSRRGVPLQATAVGRLALGLVSLSDAQFPAKAVSGILSSRYAPTLSHALTMSPAPLLAEAAIRDDALGGTGGKGAYRTRLTNLARRLEKFSDARVAEVQRVAKACEQLFGICRQISDEAAPGELLGQWWKSLEALGLSEAIREPGACNDESGALGKVSLRALARDQAAYDALLSLRTELGEAFQRARASTPVDRATFQAWLTDAASDVNLASPGARVGAVQVLDWRELWGRKLDHVLVGGMTDGRVPGRSASSGLFPDEDRALINKAAKKPIFRLASGEVEGRAPHRLAQARLLFFQSLISARTSVGFSYSHKDDAGQEQVPSVFLDELARVMPVKRVRQAYAVLPSLEDIWTGPELQERVVLEMLALPQLRLEKSCVDRADVSARWGEAPWLKEARRVAAMEEERVYFFSRPELPPGPYSGAMTETALQAALARVFRFGPERPLSASVIGRFGNCSYQGFLSYVLKLRNREDVGEDLDSAGQGNFWHKVLELLVPRLAAAGVLSRPVEDVPSELVEQALEDAAAQVEATEHTGHPSLWRLGKERARGMVRRFLRDPSRGLPFEGLQPAHAERVFGRPSASPGWQTIAIPTSQEETPIHIEGKIDRIDEGPGRLGLVDYKSGRIRKGSVFAERLLTTEFQLPMYLYAARVAEPSRPAIAAWVSLRTGEPVSLSSMLEAELQQTVDSLLETHPEKRAQMRSAGQKNLANAVEDVVAQWRRGEFPARPDECQFCSFQAVCRISSRRMHEVDE